MIAKSFSIDISNPSITEISSFTKTKDNNGAKDIKSIVSTDGKKSFVCFINDSNESECLIYDITENTWSESSTYLSECLSGLSSLNIEYMENLNGNGKYVVYCFQSETKLNLVKFDSNFNKIEENEEFKYVSTQKISLNKEDSKMRKEINDIIKRNSNFTNEN
jgi:hypothetical protein